MDLKTSGLIPTVRPEEFLPFSLLRAGFFPLTGQAVRTKDSLGQTIPNVFFPSPPFADLADLCMDPSGPYSHPPNFFPSAYADLVPNITARRFRY